MAVHKLRRRRSRRPSFPVTVLATMLAAFALAFWWPELTTKSPTVIWPPVVQLDPASNVRSEPATDPLPAIAVPARNGRHFTCQVSSVTDGDTLRCADGQRVRLHAVAARETDETCSVGHPCPSASGASAKAELRRLVQSGALSCQAIGQSYGRVTAICRTSAGHEVNCAMIRSGTTVIWDRFNREAPICRT